MALNKVQDENAEKGLCKLAIDEDMTIYAIEGLKLALTDEIELCDKLELDLSAVEEIDSAGIQLLLALRRELMLKKKELKLTSVSSVVNNLMESYELKEYFTNGDTA